MLVGSTVLVYIFYLFQIMLTKGDTSITRTTLLNDIYNDVEIHYPGLNKFDYSFQLTANGINYLEDPTAFTLSMNLVEQQWDDSSGTATPVRNYTEIPFDK